MPSIIYQLPGSPKPNGGTSVLLEHVETLSKYGFSSFAVAPGGFKLWRETTAEIVDGSGNWSFQRGSIIILPEVTDEGMLSRYAAADSLTRVIFCQSYRGVESAANVFKNLNTFRIHDVFTNAPLVSNVLARFANVNGAQIVSCSIDTEFFKSGMKRMAVAYMPNKLPDAQEKIARLLGPVADSVEWIALNGATRDEVAKALAETGIFLALGYREGFGLPPLEAMASDCLVVGFHAQGARAYATPMNGFWHDEDDYSGVARNLKNAISLLQKKGDSYHRRILAGRQTAASYGRRRMENELLGYMTSLIISRKQKIKDFLI